MNGVVHVPFPDPYRPILAVATGRRLWRNGRALYRRTDPGHAAARRRCGGILVEPIQGEGGYVVPSRGLLPGAARTCATKHDILLIVDEVQSGMGRTGKWWAIEHFGVEPDIVCAAKGIASGMPLGVMIARKHIVNWPKGAHGNTYGGNPIACAAALATIELIEKRVSCRTRPRWASTAGCPGRIDAVRHPSIGEVRGKGLMIGVEFVKDRHDQGSRMPSCATSVVDNAFLRGLLLLGCGKSTIRIAPPLSVTQQRDRRSDGDLRRRAGSQRTRARSRASAAEQRCTPLLPDFRVRQRDYLLEISRAITQELDLDKLLARILSISIEMLAGQAGSDCLARAAGWAGRWLSRRASPLRSCASSSRCWRTVPDTKSRSASSCQRSTACCRG